MTWRALGDCFRQRFPFYISILEQFSRGHGNEVEYECEEMVRVCGGLKAWRRRRRNMRRECVSSILTCLRTNNFEGGEEAVCMFCGNPGLRNMFIRVVSVCVCVLCCCAFCRF